MFLVGKIETTHSQWTVGEFTYAYMRALTAIRNKDYLIAHSNEDGFDLYLTPRDLKLNLSCSDPVPVRVGVHHAMGLTPQEMTEHGFAIVAKSILVETTRELAARCPKRSSCMCRVYDSYHWNACGTPLTRGEFLIEGMIAKAD